MLLKDNMRRLRNSAISSEFLNSNKVLTSKNVIECLYCFSFFFAVDISLQNATIFVNFPFLFRLLEFFTSPTPAIQKQHDLVTTASQTSLDNFVPPNAISTGTEVTDVPRREQDRGGISRPEASKILCYSLNLTICTVSIFCKSWCFWNSKWYG